MEIAVLALGAFFAGLIDAIAGGGGLIQIPLLLTVFPAYPIPLLFGTSKISSLAGTSTAVFRYAGSVALRKDIIIPSAAAALAGSALGAGSVHLIPQQILKPLVFILLIAVGSYTFLRPSFGKEKRIPVITRAVPLASAIIGFALGFYDGFFGPGTGSFLIFIFVRLFGLDMLRASATSKAINLATNVSATVLFAFQGSVMWKIGLFMAAANIIGAQAGTHLALKHGSSFIRWIMLAVVSALTVKLGIDLFVK